MRALKSIALYSPAILLLYLFCVSCASAVQPSWKEELKDELPLLGHRNWIIVTDMAYPLQTGQGIRTIYTDAPYLDVLRHVSNELNEALHVKPIVYQDSELLSLDNEDAEGIDDLRIQMERILGDKVSHLSHEKLIARLDSVSRTFQVIVLKSRLALPYTSTFFELDCGYWNSAKEEALRMRSEAAE